MDAFCDQATKRATLGHGSILIESEENENTQLNNFSKLIEEIKSFKREKMSAEQKKQQKTFPILKLNSFDKPPEIDLDEIENHNDKIKKQNDSKSFINFV